MEDRDSSLSRVSDFMIDNNKYNKGHSQQATFEENIVALMVKAYTPLSLVNFRELRKVDIIVGSTNCFYFAITSLKKVYYSSI